MLRTILRLLVVALGPCVCLAADSNSGDSATPLSASEVPLKVDFAKQIRPLLNEHCAGCHGGVKAAADLSFASREAAIWAFEPGQPDDSMMVERIESDDPDYVMPPPEHGAPLSDDEKQLVRRWIRQGATWALPWAYQPVRRPTAPAVDDPDWCNNEIDAYVLSQLESIGWKPNGAADPSLWLRRVTFDLTGIPPSVTDRRRFLEEVDRFGEKAYAMEVDRLLADPRFGERWASAWLDQIRYADSRGLGLDGRRRIWKYRDWVVRSINHDMPFDEFTIKQIAGDLVDQPSIDDRLATAAHRLTQTNEEGGTDDEEFRVAAVLDRVNTVWQTWQGITFGCVQCHSHPYDPIQHEEYYQFVAFFNNTADCDLNEDYPLLQVPLDPTEESRAGELDRQIESLRKQVFDAESAILNDDVIDWRAPVQLDATADKQTEVIVQDDPRAEAGQEFVTVDTLSSGTTITLTAQPDDAMDALSAIRLTLRPRDPDSGLADSEWGFVLSSIKVRSIDAEGGETELPIERLVVDDPDPFMRPSDSLNDKNKQGFAAYSRIHHSRRVALILEQTAKLGSDTRIEVRLKHNVQLLAAFPLVSRRGRLDLSGDPTIADRLNVPELLQLRRDLDHRIGQRKQIPSVGIPVLAERPEHLKRPTHVFDRGLFLTKGERVQPDVPAVLPDLTKSSGGEQADRMDLARWLVSDENPLTPRVFVNRVWARLFGMGLVATEEDFGSSGDPPTHPELLEYLASRFRGSDDWSLKPLVRDIVLSATYRQSSNGTDDRRAEDAANRYLARGPRFRMTAEMVRDAALAASGLLSNEIGGAPVHPPIPEGVWKPFQGGDKWDTAPVSSGDRYRRSIYTYTKRSIPYPMFATFDAPSREFCTPRRLRSNTPLQALVTLNDDTFVECASALARSMRLLDRPTPDRIAWGFEAVTTRPPNPDEHDRLVRLYKAVLADGGDAETAMIDVATVLLNLDEITNK
ncbi:Planctomycete cytochrome C [Crateriforma conspicua]|nr:Planctomycete cytochrome C [Crateriforma conspicua]